MRTIILALLLLFDFAGYTQCSNPYKPSYFIPSSGCSTTNLNYFDLSNQNIYVSTNGSVNLGSNTYTLTYGSLPDATATWNVIFDASNLTLSTPSNVNLFGEQPLSKYPNTTVFFINFSVVWSASGVSTKTVSYFPSLNALNQFNNITTFNGSIYSNDSLVAKRIRLSPQTPIAAGTPVLAADTSGNFTYGCPPCAWNILGNTGTGGGTHFIGTSDSADLRFGINGMAGGIISYNGSNVALGPQAFTLNTTGQNNTAIGSTTLYSNTSGIKNTAIGQQALLNSTTANNGTAVGFQALKLNTTGLNNTALGYEAGITNTTGANNIAIGYLSNVATSSTSNAIAIGANASASTNQCAIAGVENLYLNGMNSGVGYDLTDSTGTGVFIAKKPFGISGTYFTPVTSDSIAITNGKNTINPSGTIANLTLIFPANPIAYQTYFFSFTQVVTAMHYSVRLSGGANPTGLPSAETVNGTFSAYYDPNLATWMPASH